MNSYRNTVICCNQLKDLQSMQTTVNEIWDQKDFLTPCLLSEAVSDEETCKVLFSKKNSL